MIFLTVLFVLPVAILYLLGWEWMAAGYSLLLLGFVVGLIYARWAIVSALAAPTDPGMTKLYRNVTRAVERKIAAGRTRW